MSTALDESQAMLVRRWGEMGGYWGINRTMAEIHALLYVSSDALCTDDLMSRLQISRGNASMNVRGLVDWGLIRRVHKLGDRKEYFEADTDVWRMFETIMRERRRREVEPILATIDRSLEKIAANQDAADPAQVAEFGRRLNELRSFLNTMGVLFELVLRFGSRGIESLAKTLTAPAVAAPSVATVVPPTPPLAAPKAAARRGVTPRGHAAGGGKPRPARREPTTARRRR